MSDYNNNRYILLNTKLPSYVLFSKEPASLIKLCIYCDISVNEKNEVFYTVTGYDREYKTYDLKLTRDEVFRQFLNDLFDMFVENKYPNYIISEVITKYKKLQ